MILLELNILVYVYIIALYIIKLIGLLIAAGKRAFQRETGAMMCFVISCATHELRGVVTVITYVTRSPDMYRGREEQIIFLIARWSVFESTNRNLLERLIARADEENCVTMVDLAA